MSVDLVELKRFKQMLAFERKAKKQGYQHICGVDEAGRGPLAGPVVAAACILPRSIHKNPDLFPHLNDSKQVKPILRDRLFEQLTQNKEVHYGIGIASEKEIDEVNILQATFLAMQRAVLALSVVPCVVFIDGKALPAYEVPAWPIVRGDGLSLSVAAASILAKVSRDRMMESYHSQWPQYGFQEHKGYGTKKHLEALEEHGPCPIHRRTFAPVSSL